ncbi:MAG: amidohydrolase, partial [Bacillota bacterium]
MLAITNAKIFPVDAPVIEKGSILIDAGKIVRLGPDIEIPEGAEVIDAGGRSIYPGFIDAHCHVGMMESAIGFEGDDVNEMTDPVTPHMRAIDGFNPLDETVAEAMRAGVTTVAIGPGSANPIGGTFMAIKTCGHRVDDMVVKDPLAMKIAFGENPKRVYNAKSKTPMTRMGTAAIIREALGKAVRYMEQIDRAGDDPSKLPAYDAKME